jgi:hypothetical protein
MHDLITFVLLALLAMLPLLFFGSLWLAVRHGPLRTALWRGERWYGFAAFVAVASFSAGFFGPMLLAPGANQGPMLGLFITGPLGVVAGVMWGVLRARARPAASPRK